MGQSIEEMGSPLERGGWPWGPEAYFCLGTLALLLLIAAIVVIAVLVSRAIAASEGKSCGICKHNNPSGSAFCARCGSPFLG